jgi:hypothetical protein
VLFVPLFLQKAAVNNFAVAFYILRNFSLGLHLFLGPREFFGRNYVQIGVLLKGDARSKRALAETRLSRSVREGEPRNLSLSASPNAVAREQRHEEKKETVTASAKSF